jgi:hypothetical protein
MNRLFAFLLLAFAAHTLAQAPHIPPNATVYIEPMDGYETYLAAAIAKKQVPLILVADKTKADYVITSTVSHRSSAPPAVVINNTNANGGGNPGFEEAGRRAEAQRAARGSTSASISVIDAHSSQIIFAYAVGKSANTNQVQSTAEACAKHLKEFIEKPKK